MTALANRSTILDEDLVSRAAEAVAASLGSPIMELAERFGVSLQDTIRFFPVTHRCIEVRENAGLRFKDVAGQLRVPQYRIREIESGHINQIQPVVFREYLRLLGLGPRYAEWSQANLELAKRLENKGPRVGERSMGPHLPSSGVSFRGEVIGVKARIRLLRSFDQISHQYQGYTLLMATAGQVPPQIIRVAIGPAAHAAHQFRIGDVVSGKAQPVLNRSQEWADLYKASGLKVELRGPTEQDRPADPDGGIAPPLEVYRANGHRRLDPHTCQTRCASCPWGLTMATEITIDQWNPSKKRWRMETHCYGPRDCPRYRAGAPRRVPGRKPGMVWIDNDVEREAEE